MFNQIIRFLNLLMAGVMAGILLGIWLGYNPENLSAPTYVEQQQEMIRALNTLMPILGFITIVLTIVATYHQRRNRTALLTLLAALCLLIITGLITRLGNQPINSIVLTWEIANPPGDWTEFRDKWWSLHIVRTVTIFVAFCLIIWTNIRKEPTITTSTPSYTGEPETIS